MDRPDYFQGSFKIFIGTITSLSIKTTLQLENGIVMVKQINRKQGELHWVTPNLRPLSHSHGGAPRSNIFISGPRPGPGLIVNIITPQNMAIADPI